MGQQEKHSVIIFYADDDKDDIEFLREAFSSYSNDIELIVRHNGMTAFHYFQTLGPSEQAPCLIILDINMPLMGGKEVLQKLRNIDRFKHTPVVLFTTSSSIADKVFADEHGANFITKPIDVYELENIAESFIEHCADEIKSGIRKNQTN